VQALLKEEKTVAQIASEHGVHPTQLNQWKAQALVGMASLFERKDTTLELKASYEKKLEEAYTEIGRLTTQLAWLEKKSGWISES
jgi:transposase